jgi:hypothetical protein
MTERLTKPAYLRPRRALAAGAARVRRRTTDQPVTIGTTVAVAVDEPSVVVLDDCYQVVEDGLAAQAGFGMGLTVASGGVFAPYYERAKRTRETVEFVEYLDGRVMRVTVVPQKDRLVVTWQTLCMLDVLTLEGLRSSLDEVVETLARAEQELRRNAVRGSLRLVEGGR